MRWEEWMLERKRRWPVVIFYLGFIDQLWLHRRSLLARQRDYAGIAQCQENATPLGDDAIRLDVAIL